LASIEPNLRVDVGANSNHAEENRVSSENSVDGNTKPVIYYLVIAPWPSLTLMTLVYINETLNYLSP